MPQINEQEYKNRHNWVGEVIYRELCNKFKFGHTNKLYMHNSDSVQENKLHKILCDFEIQTDHQFLDTRPNFVIVNEKKENPCRIVYFAFTAESKNKRKWKER